MYIKQSLNYRSSYMFVSTVFSIYYLQKFRITIFSKPKDVDFCVCRLEYESWMFRPTYYTYPNLCNIHYHFPHRASIETQKMKSVLTRVPTFSFFLFVYSVTLFLFELLLFDVQVFKRALQMSNPLVDDIKQISSLQNQVKATCCAQKAQQEESAPVSSGTN